MRAHGLGRIGVFFRPKADERITPGSDAAKAEDADNFRLADRTALSLNAAYDGAAGAPVAACGSAGVQGCRCDRGFGKLDREREVPSRPSLHVATDQEDV